MVAIAQSRLLRGSQQPGKPKPPGSNPPNRREPDETPPVEEPPSSPPAPSSDDDPLPMQTAGCGCVQEVTRRRRVGPVSPCVRA
jgi:hypothetical protein